MSEIMRKRLALVLSLVVVGIENSLPTTDGVALSFPDPVQKQTRPRRVNRQGELPDVQQEEAVQEERDPSPLVRIALAINVKSAIVSSSEPIVWLDEANRQQVSLSDQSLQIVLDPPSQPSASFFQVQFTAPGDRRSAEKLARKLKADLDQPVKLEVNSNQKQSIVRIGRFSDRSDATTIAKRVHSAGYRGARVTSAAPDSAAAPPAVAAIKPSGEGVVRASNRLVFMPTSSDSSLKVNGKSYRGSIIALRNRRALLTLVNELPLESYLLGVVPNELSPTSFGEIEALKAQAIAARTYALRNRGKYASEGYDLLPDVRSQVYEGKDSERPLASRAVAETRGLIAAYKGKPIDALYASTCGGRTEDSGAIFGEAQPYLKSVACSPEKGWLSSTVISSTRKGPLDRGLPLLSIAGITLPTKVTEDYLAAKASPSEVREWAASLSATLSGPTSAQPMSRAVKSQQSKSTKGSTSELALLADTLVQSFYPDGYAATLLSPADVDYMLDFPDAKEISAASRPAVALLVRDGILAPFADGLLKPSTRRSRRDVLTMLSRIVDRGESSLLDVGTVVRLSDNVLTIRPPQAQAVALAVEPDAFIYKRIAGIYLPTMTVLVVGGERIRYHRNQQGQIDFLEVEPSLAGVAADRYSPFSRWEVTVGRRELSEQVRQYGVAVGRLTDLKIVHRGASRRVTELEIVGSSGSKKVKGQAIRTALGLRDTLFVIGRKRDASGQVAQFTFTGRGWGHGVGLCQMGAYGLALNGLTFENILKTYYTGIEIEKAY
jgi:stage II sporulation protein D